LDTVSKSLKATLEYDFEQEIKFTYKGLNEQEIVEHITHFISHLWQIHIFGEGNTRTTASFLIKYLRKLGFKRVNNDLFENHSWYFRNALVRANYEDLSQGIHKTDKFLIYFLSNLLLDKQYSLRNREIHILFGDTVNLNSDTVKSENDTVNTNIDTVKPKNDTVNDAILVLIKQNNNITAAEICEKLDISLSTAKRRLKRLKESS